MKQVRPVIAAIAATSALAFTASAQTALKPGLWEIHHKTATASGQMEQGMAQMQQQMAAMSPEQRKMVEDMMASRGVKMGPGGAAGGMSLRICMTPEMAQRREVPTQQRGDCQTSHQPSGRTTKIAFTCTNPASSGEGEVTFASPESYTMKMNVKTAVQGRPETVTMEGSGQWLGSDCGDVKPMRPAK